MASKREKRPPLLDNIGTKYTMLDPAFDKGHRARFIENGVMLLPLRMRGHGTTIKMQYDEHHASYHRRARLLGFVLQFKRKPAMLVHSALTTLIDRGGQRPTVGDIAPRYNPPYWAGLIY